MSGNVARTNAVLQHNERKVDRFIVQHPLGYPRPNAARAVIFLSWAKARDCDGLRTPLYRSTLAIVRLAYFIFDVNQ